MSREIGGAQIYLKREDLNHTGAHKINNVIGQAMLARRGQASRHCRNGRRPTCVATATICARYGLQYVVYMGSEDVKRQSPKRLSHEAPGRTVVPVESGSKTLKDALNEAMRDWVTNVKTPSTSSAPSLAPHPTP